MEFSWITDIFSKMEMKFASISFLILRASVWCSWNTATNQSETREQGAVGMSRESALLPALKHEGVWRDAGTLLPLDPTWRRVRDFGQGWFFSFAILIWSSSCLCKTTSLKSFNFSKKILLLNKANNNKNTPVCLKSGYLTDTTLQTLLLKLVFSPFLFHRRDRLFINTFFMMHLKVFCTQLFRSKQISLDHNETFRRGWWCFLLPFKWWFCLQSGHTGSRQELSKLLSVSYFHVKYTFKLHLVWFPQSVSATNSSWQSSKVLLMHNLL